MAGQVVHAPQAYLKKLKPGIDFANAIRDPRQFFAGKPSVAVAARCRAESNLQEGIT